MRAGGSWERRAGRIVPQLRGRTPHSSWGETGLQPGEKIRFAGEITVNIGYTQSETIVQGEAHRPVQVHWGEGIFDQATAPWAAAPPISSSPDERSVLADVCRWPTRQDGAD